MMRDPEKARERKRRYLLRQKIKKYGPNRHRNEWRAAHEEGSAGE